MNNNKEIQELLERREILSEMAEILYGDLWVANDDFWNSPTDMEMREIQIKLLDLGWEANVEDDIRALGEILGEDLINRGIIDPPEWWEDEDDDDDEDLFI
jgi:hypothetical protein